MSRNVPILSISQALGFSGAAMVVLVGGIIGIELSPSPSWATLPISLMVVGVALATIPASLLMRKIGRRRGFMVGAALAGLAAMLGAYAIFENSFILFCAAGPFFGVSGAFVQQYRFAAVESVPAESSARAISFVLLGGIAGGFFGPEIAKLTRDWLAWGAYAGSFLSLALLQFVAMILLSLLKDIPPSDEEINGVERSFREVAAQPTYLLAVLAGTVGYGVMSLIMTATPLYLHSNSGYSVDQTAFVIQSHIIAMYLPSLFTGFILERLGLVRVLILGVFSLTASVILGVFAQQLLHYWSALVLLGLGWNFLFVGGTVLLTRSYRPAERFKAQAANDFIIFGVRAFTSLLAGSILFYANWQILNLTNLPFLLLTLVSVFALRRHFALYPAETGSRTA
jgi:MFS family permease